MCASVHVCASVWARVLVCAYACVSLFPLSSFWTCNKLTLAAGRAQVLGLSDRNIALPEHEIEIGKKLGSGAAGDVFRVSH